jgi:hypothetical protein
MLHAEPDSQESVLVVPLPAAKLQVAALAQVKSTALLLVAVLEHMAPAAQSIAQPAPEPQVTLHVVFSAQIVSIARPELAPTSQFAPSRHSTSQVPDPESQLTSQVDPSAQEMSVQPSGCVQLNVHVYPRPHWDPGHAGPLQLPPSRHLDSSTISAVQLPQGDAS